VTDPAWTRYQLREKIFAIGEDFWIENERGEPAYKVDGKALSLRHTFVLEDLHGSTLATIENRLLSLRPTMTIERGGEAYATVEKALLTFLHEHYTIEVANGSVLEAGGDITGHAYEIKSGDNIVAEVSRAWFSLRDAYGIAIVPGQDPVLLLAVAVCIDELSERAREGNRGSSLFPG